MIAALLCAGIGWLLIGIYGAEGNWLAVAFALVGLWLAFGGGEWLLRKRSRDA